MTDVVEILDDGTLIFYFHTSSLSVGHAIVICLHVEHHALETRILEREKGKKGKNKGTIKGNGTNP